MSDSTWGHVVESFPQAPRIIKLALYNPYFRSPQLYWLMRMRRLRSLPMASNFRAAIALDFSRVSFFPSCVSRPRERERERERARALSVGFSIYLRAHTLGISMEPVFWRNCAGFLVDIAMRNITPNRWERRTAQYFPVQFLPHSLSRLRTEDIGNVLG